MTEDRNVKLVGPQCDDATISVPKPGSFSLDKFKSKHADAIANVETLLTALAHHKISEARDFVRPHPDEDNYWSPELKNERPSAAPNLGYLARRSEAIQARRRRCPLNRS
jgi:hypothetical protein